MQHKEATAPVAMLASTTTNLCGKNLTLFFSVDLIYLNKDLISCDLKAIKIYSMPWQINKKVFLLSFTFG